MLKDVALALVAAVAGVLAGYRVGRRVAGNRVALVVISAVCLVAMVALVALAMMRGDRTYRLVALGATFGLITGVRHGAGGVMAMLLEPVTPARDGSQVDAEQLAQALGAEVDAHAVADHEGRGV